MENGLDLSSSLSFSSSSYLSNGSSSHDMPSLVGCEVGMSPELLSLHRLSLSLEKLVVSEEYDYSDADIEVEGVTLGVNRCILAARSEFFHELFRNADRRKEGKPKYLMSELVPHGRIGYEAFMVVLSYLYTGKLKASPIEVSTCVDESCAHDACGPAINYAVEMMYASAMFQIKELVTVVKHRLLKFVDKALVEDVIPILIVASHCELKELLSHCLDRVARSDLDNTIIEKELPREVLNVVKSLRLEFKQDEEGDSMQADPLNEKRIRRIHRALDSDDVELVMKLLLEEITLDAACALHYAVAYCDPKIVNEVLNLGNADVNLRNSRGYTVLHVAARRKDLSIVVRLLHKGASVSDITEDGQTAVMICRRLTRPKDINEAMKHGEETNTDKLFIDVLEREIRRNPSAGNMSISSMMLADDHLYMRLLLLENRVAMARSLFPREARVAMQIADTDSTKEFAGISASKGSFGNFKVVDLNEIPCEQGKRRLQALQKTEEAGRRFFPNCSEVLDQLLEDDTLGALLLEKGTPEEQCMKRMRYIELKEDVMKAFDKDKAEQKLTGLSSSSACSNSPKGSAIPKVRRR